MRTPRILLALVALLAGGHLIVGPGALPAAQAADDVTLTCFPHGAAETVYDDTWGASRSGGRGHRGTDIMSDKGVEVLAVADGVVETLGNGPRSGYYIRLVHAGGWESWYMHLANDTPGTDDGRGGEATAYADGLDEGDVVAAGQLIGYVGDSGNAEWTGSHTHFELHIDGRAVNPYDHLVEADARMQNLLKLVAGYATLSAHDLDETGTGGLWGALIEAGGVECLPSAFKKAIEHLFGELPGEGVLLTRVVTR